MDLSCKFLGGGVDEKITISHGCGGGDCGGCGNSMATVITAALAMATAAMAEAEKEMVVLAAAGAMTVMSNDDDDERQR